MEKVLGVGGIFFRAKDPASLGAWYETHLGINPVPQGADMAPWITKGGVTILAPFDDDTDYFAAENRFMINFRVADLDAMLAQLRGAGIEVSHETSMDGLGRFARIHDPEGNPIELWEPA